MKALPARRSHQAQTCGLAIPDRSSEPQASEVSVFKTPPILHIHYFPPPYPVSQAKQTLGGILPERHLHRRHGDRDKHPFVHGSQLVDTHSNQENDKIVHRCERYNVRERPEPWTQRCQEVPICIRIRIDLAIDRSRCHDDGN